MATNQKKKSGSSSSRSRSNSSKKSSSSRSGNSRSSNNRSGSRGSSSKNQSRGSSGDGLSKVLLILFLGLLVVLIISNILKDKEEDEGQPTPTPTVQITAALTPTAAPTREGTGELTPSPTPTTAPTPTPVPSPEPTAALTPTEPPAEPEASITLDEADAMLAELVNVEGYGYELSDDHLWKDGRMYYCYVITYQQVEQYAILLDQESGEMYYYDTEGKTTPLEHFPMDSIEAPEQGGNTGVTEEKAVEWLSEVSFTSLALPAPLSECEVSLDAWKTMVYGEECYCLNVFYQDMLAGTIYFTEAAETIYYLDEFGEFIRVR